MSKAAGDKSAKSTAKSDDAADDNTPAAEDKSTTPKGDDDTGNDAPADSKKKPEKTFSKAEQEAAIAKALADQKKKFEDEKDLTELERIKKENEELRNANRLRDAKDDFVSAAKAAGANNGDLLFAAARDQFVFDEKTGKLTNTKDLIDALKSSYPDQFGTPKPAEGVDAGAGQDSKTTKITKEALAKMTPDEINKLDWNEVRAVLAS